MTDKITKIDDTTIQIETTQVNTKTVQLAFLKQKRQLLFDQLTKLQTNLGAEISRLDQLIQDATDLGIN